MAVNQNIKNISENSFDLFFEDARRVNDFIVGEELGQGDLEINGKYTGLADKDKKAQITGQKYEVKLGAYDLGKTKVKNISGGYIRFSHIDVVNKNLPNRITNQLEDVEGLTGHDWRALTQLKGYNRLKFRPVRSQEEKGGSEQDESTRGIGEQPDTKEINPILIYVIVALIAYVIAR